jgi:hypothetical protein
MALTATIWNPPLAVALVKLATAVVLWAGETPSVRAAVTATGLAWLAVQAHSAAIFVAAPIIGTFVLREILARRWKAAAGIARTLVEVILVLQIPWVLHLIMSQPAEAGPTQVARSVAYTFTHPGDARVWQAFDAVSRSTSTILFMPTGVRAAWLFVAVTLVVVGIRARRQLGVLSVTVFPLLSTALGFAMWQQGFDLYWFLTMAPALAISLALALTVWRPAAPAVGLLACALVVVAQPSRLRASATIHRLPQYGTLVRASREIRRNAPIVRSVDAMLPLPPTTDVTFIYRIFGGQLSENAPVSATIGPAGQVSFRAVKTTEEP